MKPLITRPLARLSLALATTLLLLLASCSKDNETAPSANKTTLLTGGGPWRISSYTRTTGSGAPADQQALKQACARDDRYAFGGNGVLTITEGPTGCGSAAPNALVGTAAWTFNSAQTQLTIGSGSNAIPYEVVALNADRLQLRWTRTSSGQTVVDNLEYVN